MREYIKLERENNVQITYIYIYIYVRIFHIVDQNKDDQYYVDDSWMTIFEK